MSPWSQHYLCLMPQEVMHILVYFCALPRDTNCQGDNEFPHSLASLATELYESGIVADIPCTI